MSFDRLSKLRRPIFVGPIWGLLQSATLFLLVYGSIWLGLRNPLADGFGFYFGALLQAELWFMAGLSCLAGFWLAEYDKAVKALLISQLVAFITSPFIIVTNAFLSPSLDERLISISVVSWLFFTGLIGSMAGSFLADRARPVRTRLLGWRFYGMGLLIDGIVVLLSISPPASLNAFPLMLGGWTIPILLILVVWGVVSLIFGIRGKSPLRSDLLSLLMIAAFLLVGFSAISISFAYRVYTMSSSSALCGTSASCSGQAQDFLIIGLLAAATLLVSLGTLVGSSHSEQQEGIAETLGIRNQVVRVE